MKTLVLDAIIGVGLPSVTLALECERVGLARLAGDPFDPHWEWIRDRLEACSLEQLQELYTGLREARDEIAEQVEAEASKPIIELAH